MFCFWQFMVWLFWSLGKEYITKGYKMAFSWSTTILPEIYKSEQILNAILWGNEGKMWHKQWLTILVIFFSSYFDCSKIGFINSYIYYESWDLIYVKLDRRILLKFWHLVLVYLKKYFDQNCTHKFSKYITNFV